LKAENATLLISSTKLEKNRDGLVLVSSDATMENVAFENHGWDITFVKTSFTLTPTMFSAPPRSVCMCDSHLLVQDLALEKMRFEGDNVLEGDCTPPENLDNSEFAPGATLRRYYHLVVSPPANVTIVSPSGETQVLRDVSETVFSVLFDSENYRTGGSVSAVAEGYAPASMDFFVNSPTPLEMTLRPEEQKPPSSGGGGGYIFTTPSIKSMLSSLSALILVLSALAIAMGVMFTGAAPVLGVVTGSAEEAELFQNAGRILVTAGMVCMLFVAVVVAPVLAGGKPIILEWLEKLFRSLLPQS